MNNKGFTLIEIMVALVIFSLIFLPLTAVLVAESKFEQKHEQKLVAMAVAKNEIETAKKTYNRLADETYQVRMAGRTWNVQRTVEGNEIAGRDSTLPKQLTTVTIRISREKDTVSLAEIRVLRETYR